MSPQYITWLLIKVAVAALMIRISAKQLHNRHLSGQQIVPTDWTWRLLTYQEPIEKKAKNLVIYGRVKLGFCGILLYTSFFVQFYGALGAILFFAFVNFWPTNVSGDNHNSPSEIFKPPFGDT